jgi:hypothetical protein
MCDAGKTLQLPGEYRSAAACVLRIRDFVLRTVMARSRPLVTRSFRIDPDLVAAARRAVGAKDDTEAVRVALAEVVERARLRRWVRKVAGKGRLRGADA